jgi:hypothetical protein
MRKTERKKKKERGRKRKKEDEKERKKRKRDNKKKKWEKDWNILSNCDKPIFSYLLYLNHFFPASSN